MLPVLFRRAVTPTFAPRLWDPFARMSRLFDLFDEDATCGYGFSVDVREDENHYSVEADLPGLERDDVEITFHDGLLHIETESKSEQERKADGYHVRERRVGRAARSFRLPEDVDANKIKAEMKNGVLTVTLPKAESAKPRKIKVKVE